MNCKRVFMSLHRGVDTMTWDFAVNLNTFFKKLKESECRIEKIVFEASLYDSQRLQIVEGISDGELDDEFDDVFFGRNDGKVSRISWTDKGFIMDVM
uniref:FBA_2 domain-containing protein n=1 Tax=Caenorhabditis tropicalis TaxID=1561998 RepID=A0A1I7TNW7_9PELO